MKVTYRGYKLTTDKNDKIFETDGSSFYTPGSVVDDTRRMLTAASALWPELKNYEVVERAKKIKKPKTT